MPDPSVLAVAPIAERNTLSPNPKRARDVRRSRHRDGDGRRGRAVVPDEIDERQKWGRRAQHADVEHRGRGHVERAEVDMAGEWPRLLYRHRCRRDRHANFVDRQRRGRELDAAGQGAGTVDVQRLGRSAGHLTQEELWSVDEAPLTVLGLD